MIRSYLIDTHVLIWWLAGDKRLSRGTVELLEDMQNNILIASPSLHEYAIKAAGGGMPFTARELVTAADRLAITILPFNWAATLVYSRVKLPHKDPFDRAIVAQALAHNVPLITADKNILGSGLAELELINPGQTGAI